MFPRLQFLTLDGAPRTHREQARAALAGGVRWIQLRAKGLVFVGIDVIGGEWLTEINVTSPTGIVSIDAFDGGDTGGMIWDAIDARLAARAAD